MADSLVSIMPGFDDSSDMTNLRTKFNITRLPDYYNSPDAYIGNIIMTRPSLNFTPYSGYSNSVESTARDNFDSMKSIGEMSKYVTDREMYKLVSQLSEYASSKYMPIIYNRAKNYTTMEYEIKTVDSNSTFFGHTMKYGLRSEEHKKAKNITIDFRNDRFLSIYHIMNFWALYIKYISNTSYLTPMSNNSLYGTLDYGASLYYLVTKRDNKELVYWEKWLGVYPTHINSSNIFNYNDTMINPEDTISIDFQACLGTDPMDPSILEDINCITFGNSSGSISGANPVTIKKDIYGFTHPTQTRAKYPYVKNSKNSKTGVIKNELLWTD